jgi:hypothetical protein
MRLLTIFLVLGLCVCFQSAWAIVTDDSVIYNGTSMSDAGITLSAWGSGDATESTLRGSVLEGRQASIRIFSDNLHSGGRIEFAKGIKLYSRGSKLSGKYLVFVMRFPGAAQSTYGQPTGLWNTTGTLGTVYGAKRDTIRFVFAEESGAKCAVVRTRTTPSSVEGWMTVGIPVAKLPLPAGKDDYVLKSVVVASDVTSQVVSGSGAVGTTGTTPGIGMGGATTGAGGFTGTGERRVFQEVEMNVGQIKTVTDSGIIRCETPKQTYNQRAINEVLMGVEADGGMAALTYTWDWGDDTVPTVGTNQGSHIYTKQGEFKVTVTVSDKDGIKKTAVTSTKVKLEW